MTKYQIKSKLLAAYGGYLTQAASNDPLYVD